jgi:hypothetical protein
MMDLCTKDLSLSLPTRVCFSIWITWFIPTSSPRTRFSTVPLVFKPFLFCLYPALNFLLWSQGSSGKVVVFWEVCVKPHVSWTKPCCSSTSRRAEIKPLVRLVLDRSTGIAASREQNLSDILYYAIVSEQGFHPHIFVHFVGPPDWKGARRG